MAKIYPTQHPQPHHNPNPINNPHPNHNLPMPKRTQTHITPKPQQPRPHIIHKLTQTYSNSRQSSNNSTPITYISNNAITIRQINTNDNKSSNGETIDN